jgi:hypothetical protein
VIDEDENLYQMLGMAVRCVLLPMIRGIMRMMWAIMDIEW